MIDCWKRFGPFPVPGMFQPVSAGFCQFLPAETGRNRFLPLSATCAAETGFCRQKPNPTRLVTNN